MINRLITFKNSSPFLYILSYGIITALLFSYFIYAEHFDITIKFINTFFGIASLALLLYAPKKAILVAGFCIGLLWFYWIGYSFEYQGVGYMLPIITLGFGIIYTLFFGVLALTNKVYIRAILLFALSFFEPFDWNWLQIELIFIESYIGIFKYQLAIVLVALCLVHYTKKSIRFLPLVLLVFAINFQTPQQATSSLKIKLIQTDIKQDEKWLLANRMSTINMVLQKTQQAKLDNYDIIIFPESVFPMYLNKNTELIEVLLDLSHDIAIITGSLLKENKQNYNVTYMFYEGKYTVAKKMVLVPFGEYIPLPSFARQIINNTFFSGQSDFIQAKSPQTLQLKVRHFVMLFAMRQAAKNSMKGMLNS